MSERDDDAKVSERYRALPREEPGTALDAAILAASRRAVGARPGGALRRWTLPVSVAAVVVLSVTLTLQVQRERPDDLTLPAPEPKRLEQGAPRDATSAVREAQAPAAPPASVQPRKAERAIIASEAPAAGRKRETERAQPEVARSADEARASSAAVAGRREFAPDSAAASAPAPVGRVEAPAESLAQRAPAPAPPAPEALPGQRADVAAPQGLAASDAMRRSAPAVAELREKRAEAEESPERWLERIVALRAAGRDREADESYAAFRKRYPDYRISEELLGKLGVKR